MFFSVVTRERKDESASRPSLAIGMEQIMTTSAIQAQPSEHRNRFEEEDVVAQFYLRGFYYGSTARSDRFVVQLPDGKWYQWYPEVTIGWIPYSDVKAA